MYISQLAATAWKDDIRLDDDGVGAKLSEAAAIAGEQHATGPRNFSKQGCSRRSYPQEE